MDTREHNIGELTADGLLSGEPQRAPSINRVIEMMPGFVYVFNHQTFSNEYMNRSIAAYLGYSSAQIQALGDQVLAHIVHPHDFPSVASNMERIAQLKDDESLTIEYRVIRKDGAIRWLRSVDTVFDRCPEGRVLRHIGSATDITVEKTNKDELAALNVELEAKVIARTAELAMFNAELEERITERTSQLEDAVVELEQLTFIATHDLKVPANNLSRLALMLQDHPDQPREERVELVRWINTSAAQLHSKIHGLVLVAQIRLSSALPAKMFNLRDEVMATIGSLQKAMGQNALPVIVDVAPQIEVFFARFELSSILSSILDNAVKYAAPDRPLSITIRATEVDGRVTLAIADNGTGIDEATDSGKVFGLFQRAHKAPAGNGISLYCAKRMLQHRGGSITLSGTRGQGAEFQINFPDKDIQHDSD
ncbi:PAS domain-containing sensor histidine kinase [Sulfitobacter sp. HNIBRBA2951]|uniref:sensor histidine kinase n=1 Tax=Sulfitobacter aquimarinus TaxID=3158557 RepID=UPI0032DE30C7